jgi:hypothetical protein
MPSNRRLTRTLLLLALVAFAAHSITLAGTLPNALPSTGDAFGQFASWHAFVQHSLLSRGEIPFWNPHIYCGVPFLSNGQSGLFYPPNALYYLLPQNAGIWILAYGHTLFLMVGTYFLGRTLGLKRRASFLAALLFGLGNATPAHLFGGHLTFLPTRSYWPWTAMFLLRLLQGKGRSNAIYLAACLALGLAAGAPQMWIFGVLCCACITVVRMLPRTLAKADFSRSKGRVLPSLILAGLLAGLCCAPILLPLRELKSWSSHGGAMTFDEVTQLSATPLSLFRLLYNGFFGGNSTIMWSLPSNAGEDAASIGFVPFFLALLAPFIVRGSHTVRWLYVGCIGAMVLALGAATPLYRVLYDHVLLFQITRVPARWLELWAFGAALLCGFTFDALLKSPHRAAPLQRLWMGGFVATGVLFITSLLTKAPWQHGARVVIQALNVPSKYLVSLASTLQASAITTCFLTLAVLFLLLLAWRHGLARNRAVVFVIAMLVADPLTQFWLSSRISPPQALKDYYVPEAIVRWHEKGQRWIINAPFGQLNSPFLAGIDTLNGYEPFGSAPFFEYVAAAQGKTEFSADFRPRQMAPLWRVAGASHFLWKPQFEGDEAASFPGREIEREGQWRLKELQDGLQPWPRAYLTTAAIRATPANRYAALGKASLTRYRGSPPVVVEPDFPVIKGTSHAMKLTAGQATPNVINWNIETGAPAVFIHQEALAPGWVAYVDGKRSPVHRVNGFFRGVAVPAGSRSVALVYDSQTLRFALFLALFACGFAVSALTLARKRSPR